MSVYRRGNAFTRWLYRVFGRPASRSRRVYGPPGRPRPHYANQVGQLGTLPFTDPLSDDWGGYDPDPQYAVDSNTGLPLRPTGVAEFVRHTNDPCTVEPTGYDGFGAPIYPLPTRKEVDNLWRMVNEDRPGRVSYNGQDITGYISQPPFPPQDAA